MTTPEYKSLGLDERRVLFIAALVPVGIRKETGTDGKPRYAGFADLLGAKFPAERDDVLAAVEALAEKGMVKGARPGGRMARETLAAMAEEADRRGWWPSCDAFAKAYESKDEAGFSELMMAYWLSMAAGSGRAYAERIREREPESAGRLACEAVSAAMQAFVELVDDDPDLDAMPESFFGVPPAAQIRIWLECAFWNGRDVRKTLKALGERPMLFYVCANWDDKHAAAWLEKSEAKQPGVIKSCVDALGRNLLWYTQYNPRHGRAEETLLKHGCDPDAETVWGLSWRDMKAAR